MDKEEKRTKLQEKLNALWAEYNRCDCHLIEVQIADVEKKLLDID